MSRKLLLRQEIGRVMMNKYTKPSDKYQIVGVEVCRL